MTVGEWLNHARQTLQDSGCPDPQIDSRWMAEDVLRLTPAELHFQLDRAIDRDTLDTLNRLLARRASGEPVQYILGSASFMGLRFEVDGRVLIPRQDTETLVEALVVAVRALEAPKVLDLCTGSGAIGLSLKTLAPKAEVTLTDISRDALEVAHRNARLLNVEAEFRHGDLFRAVGKERFDIIASNPPYIPTEELSHLQREVQAEPVLALDGGADGLDFYRRIAQEAPRHLLPDGAVYLEVGAGEAEAVLALLRKHLRCVDSGVIDDLNGIARVVWARSV
ncbi:MAG: peptide chain release factor N(5)-glutamine methyltransferase [Clostridia bacterium]|nr:peptide chain release factor N(5)-glutamine methyltransferase [Clostridia bacterium]